MERVKKTRDKRKILLVLPLMLLPFMALAFYAMGGGRGEMIDSSLASKGINTALPDANFKVEEPVDKMGFYAKAGKDTSGSSGGLGISSKLGFGAEDEKTSEINAKLEALNREINSTPVNAVAGGKSSAYAQATKQNDAGIKTDVDRLEQMMKSMSEGKQKDPEMEQMNSVLEKILDIQNPVRAQQKVLGRIYSGQDLEKFSAITAVIDGNQKVVQGASVKLRLTDSVLLSGVMIPKGHLLFGLCKITNQRLLLDIKNVRLGSQIIPVDLSVYSLDGMPGIDAPDAVFRDAAGMGAADGISGVSVYGMEGVGGELAGVGIDAAKGLLSKRVRVVKVKLKSGLQVLLRNNEKNR
ncbi:conjugative transposon protein TraM [Pedobacter sp. LMG 31464]|uniref:Conjugative transposon protein TraM n=1 Tax=Pedobacter planticolens TaxID=2679964 RepID=A0A923IV97_9SPHI|nr:conjugative transposon protein TraM [Pedobacter planticolens]MBB2146820.1 conjugative transposon protein TraM [Pedobacter planticolens]